jgi:TatD DNase family protein
MSYFIDAHCHLDLLKDIQLNVSKEDSLPIKSISVTNAPFIFEHSNRLFNGSKNIRVALGMHPELVSQYGNQIDLFSRMIQNTKYIGEVGLDGSPRFKESFDYQKKVLIEILKLCKRSNSKILTIHSRNAATEIIELLKRYLFNSDCKVIFHWYSGSIDELKVAIRNEFYFSINHKMISTDKGKQIIMAIPKHLLLTETDAPFSFDQSIRSRLQSLEKTVSALSAIRKTDAPTIRDQIYNNFKSLLESIN